MKGNTPWTRHGFSLDTWVDEYPPSTSLHSASLNLSTSRYPDQISVSVPGSKSTFPQFTHLMTETGQWTDIAVDQIFKVWPNNCGKLSRAALLTTPLTALYRLINQVANCVLITFFKNWNSVQMLPIMALSHHLARQMEARFDHIFPSLENNPRSVGGPIIHAFHNGEL